MISLFHEMSREIVFDEPSDKLFEQGTREDLALDARVFKDGREKDQDGG